MVDLPPKRPVLIIEPSPTLRAVLEVHVTSAGHPCASYAHPLPALADLRQYQDGPILVLLSEAQPPSGPSGWNVLRILLLQRQWPVQVIFLLEEAEILAPIEARVAGACAVLSKPFRIQEMLESLWRCGQI